jgi:hypothetical protein
VTEYPIGIKPSKASKKPYKGQAHTPASPKGVGDYYGTGVRAKLAKIRSGLGQEILSERRLSKPPRSLV